MRGMEDWSDEGLTRLAARKALREVDAAGRPDLMRASIADMTTCISTRPLEVMFWRFDQQLPHREIGVRMGVSAARSRQLCAKGLRMMAARLKKL